MSSWQAIVFDLDDTLYPERDFVLSGFRAVAMWGERYLGIPAIAGFAELASLHTQGVRGDTFNRWLIAHGQTTDELVLELVRVYREHTPTLRPFPDVPDVLARLRRRYRLGMLTDGYLTVQRRKLEAVGLADYFDCVLYSDELGREYWKPSVRPFQTMLGRLGVDPRRAVYVGDNPTKDFLGARQCGIGTIWVRRPEGEYSHLEPATMEHQPDIVLTTLFTLEHDLLELENQL